MNPIKNSRSRSIFIASIALALVFGAIFYYLHSKDSAKADLTLFQPDGQMLSEAMQPGVTDTLGISGTSSIPTAQGYTYDPTLCTTGTTTPFLCLAAYYKSLVAHQGVDIAFQDIKLRYTQNQEVQ